MKNETNQNIIQKWPERLVLVRHGQSIYNEERELVNRGVIKTYTVNVKGVRGSDFPLSAKGEKQAKKVAILLKKEFKKFDIVFTSPFKRAHDTARIIAKKLPKTRFVIEERIREKEFGIADGMTPAEMKELFPYEYARKQKQKKYYYRPIGGESYPDINLRVWAFLTTIVREYSGQNILVVAHSAILLSFRKVLEKLSEAEILKINKEDFIENCAIISYRFDPTIKPKPKMKLEMYNKVAR